MNPENVIFGVLVVKVRFDLFAVFVIFSFL